MPELPEVELARRSMERWSRGATIVAAEVMNLSTDGFMAETEISLETGASVWLKLPGLEPQNSRVIWTEDGRTGFQFAAPLHPATLELLVENNRLRALLELRPGLSVKSQAAQVLYEASDPYSRKVIIDRGATNGIDVASPVINETGVLGQVTRVYPLSSEVTLLTDKDAAIPVLNTRTQARSAAFGSAAVVGGGMEMRFMAGNADVQVGDTLTTSGVDGIYPPGLPVAKVASVDRKNDSGFARIVLTPIAQPDGVRHVMVLEPVGVQMPARPASAAEDGKAPPPKKGGRK